MATHTFYRATYERNGGQVTSSHDMTQDYVERIMRGATHLAFWADAPEHITCDSTVRLVSVERVTDRTA